MTISHSVVACNHIANKVDSSMSEVKIATRIRELHKTVEFFCSFVLLDHGPPWPPFSLYFLDVDSAEGRSAY